VPPSGKSCSPHWHARMCNTCARSNYSTSADYGHLRLVRSLLCALLRLVAGHIGALLQLLAGCLSGGLGLIRGALGPALQATTDWIHAGVRRAHTSGLSSASLWPSRHLAASPLGAFFRSSYVNPLHGVCDALQQPACLRMKSAGLTMINARRAPANCRRHLRHIGQASASIRSRVGWWSA